MQDYFLESLKLQRIDFFVKLVAASECDEEEKRLAIQWVSELTDELMAKIFTLEYNRPMDLPQIGIGTLLALGLDSDASKVEQRPMRGVSAIVHVYAA